MAIPDIKKSGFDVRIVDFSLIHNHKEEDIKALLGIINPQPGEVILDGMDGYGDVASKILAYTKLKGFQPEIYTLDESEVQVDRAQNNLPGVRPDHFVQSDMRSTPFKDFMFDTVVIKMGIHEVPKTEQSKILKEVYRILKPGGKFITWELSFLDVETQKVFQDLIRKKDELAGFDRLVSLRYFPRRDELLKLFTDAGFKNAEVKHNIDSRLSMRVRESELVSKDRKSLIESKGKLDEKDDNYLADLGKKRCDELVSFAKEYMKYIPAGVKEKLSYSETIDDIRLKPSKDILIGYK